MVFRSTDPVPCICTTFNTYLKLSDFVIRPRLFLEFAAAISVRICKDTVSPLLFQKLRSGKTKPTFLLPSLGATTISQGDVFAYLRTSKPVRHRVANPLPRRYCRLS